MHRIVALRALKVGDFLTGVPAYRAIRRAYPSSFIQLAAPRELAPLASLLGNAIDEVCDSHELEPLSPQLYDADIGVDLHGKGPASHRLLVEARAARLVAFRTLEIPQSADGAKHDAEEHEVARWCRLLQHAGIPADPNDLDVAAPNTTALTETARGATVVHPGASSRARCWPSERWIDVVRSERDAGRRVVITGGPDEVRCALAIARAAAVPEECVFAGRTNVLELAELIGVAERIVCGDTGIAHLATAFRRPSVVLFGPTPPAHWGPPARPIHRVLWAGGRGDPHADRIDAGLLSISAADVIDALRSLPAAALC
ncbi:MAG TPA: glycosyltransferase family 9 protein [Candidatus Tumulicola sp.]|jgi:ADP-heptose:LPS heptosyltransferase